MNPRDVGSGRPALLVFLLLASISTSLLLRAWLAPPKGAAFVGTFAYVDDFYNYLSMVEQAQRGVLVFQSKMASPQLPPALVNLEWLSVGWLSAALGGRPALAYQLFGLIALAALVRAAEHWVVRCGVPQERRLAALLLVFTGGGLGGALFALGQLPGERAFDLRLGAYPFVEALANPHFVAGTALLATALAAFASGRPILGAALGGLLGFVRPYDAALLVAIEAMAVVLLEPARRWLPRGLPLVALLPALAYNLWIVFRSSPGFRAWASPHYAETVPSPGDWLLMLGLPTLLMLFSLRAPREGRSGGERAHLARLQLWAAIAFAIAVLRPVTFSLQFAVGLGLPLLVLAAAGLVRLRPWALELAVPLMATSAATLVWICLTPTPRTHPPSERWRVAEALAKICQPGELVLAPAEIGLYVGGLTPCWPFVSHPAAPDYLQRLEAVSGFYDPQASPAARASLLERAHITHAVLPPALSAEWFGTASPFRPTLLVTSPNGGLAVWSRPAAP